MSDHTKGPWTIEVDGCGGVRVVATGVGSVAKMDGILSNIGSNARLIALAPEMLAALSYALEFLEANDDGAEDVTKRIKAIRSLLSRASGKGV